MIMICSMFSRYHHCVFFELVKDFGPFACLFSIDVKEMSIFPNEEGIDRSKKDSLKYRLVNNQAYRPAYRSMSRHGLLLPGSLLPLYHSTMAPLPPTFSPLDFHDYRRQI